MPNRTKLDLSHAQAKLDKLREDPAFQARVAAVRNTPRCKRCMRELTDVESIKRGIGPECFEKAGHETSEDSDDEIEQ